MANSFSIEIAGGMPDCAMPANTRGVCSSPRDLGQDVHVAVWTDRLEQGVLIDLPVDGDGRALLQMRRQRGILLAEPGEQLAHARGLEVELRHAAGILAQIADQRDVSHGFRTIFAGSL